MPLIDHIEGIEVDESIGHNELTTLSFLSTGLAMLAHQVDLMETPVREDERARRKSIEFFGFGLLPPEQESLLPCLFHWYGTSVCNYARLVGFLSGLASGAYSRDQVSNPSFHAKVREHCSAYVDSVPELQPIKVWRNKVFAHFAITDPRKDDNPAMLDASAMSPLSYFGNRLRVGGVTIGSSGGQVELPQWSVTEAHEALAPRFWPSK